MFGRLVLLFITVSILEIWVLIRVTAETSIWFTLALTILTFALGSSLIRGAAGNIQMRTAQALEKGEAPSGAMAAGLLELVAGVLLMMPGILSDIVGALLMLPPFRTIARKRLAESSFAESAHFARFGGRGGFSAPRPDDHDNPRASSPDLTSVFGADGTSFEPDFDDGYTPPQPSRSGSVIIDVEIVD